MSVGSQFGCTGIIALVFTGLLLALILFASVKQSSLPPQSGPAVQAQAATAIVVTASAP
jgi:hypothetical protein